MCKRSFVFPAALGAMAACLTPVMAAAAEGAPAHLPGAELRILLAGGEEQLIELGKDVHSTSSSFFCRGTEHTVHAAIYKNLPVFPPYVKIKNDIFP